MEPGAAVDVAGVGAAAGGAGDRFKEGIEMELDGVDALRVFEIEGGGSGGDGSG